MVTPSTKELATHCQKAGYNVRAIMSPTVKKGSERVSVCLHAGNTVEEIEGLVGYVREWVGVMEKRGETQVTGGLFRKGDRESGLGVGSEEGFAAAVAVGLKGVRVMEKAKL
ncbi:hypothetical protein NHQ30_002155 [Ciborinia camelliae]|nr:hypothetical protein NHQ30_002155 [Ciborinia camelliae]